MEPSSKASSKPAAKTEVKPPRFAGFSPEFQSEFYRLLQARRSIRKFQKKAVDETTLNRLLEAALQAPSGKNRQNWRFYVLQGAKRDEYVKLSQKSWLGIKDILEKRLKPSLFEFTERFFFTLGEAPVVILCYSYNDEEERYHTSVGSVYMAVENLNLACVAEGLGCCTMGAPLEIKAEVDKFLGVDQLPEHKTGKLELLCGVVLGWPDHDPPKAPRQHEDRIHFLT